jgi:hypothetical protein
MFFLALSWKTNGRKRERGGREEGRREKEEKKASSLEIK